MRVGELDKARRELQERDARITEFEQLIERARVGVAKRDAYIQSVLGPKAKTPGGSSAH